MVWNVYFSGPQGYVFLCGGYASKAEAASDIEQWKRNNSITGGAFEYRSESSGWIAARDTGDHGPNLGHGMTPKEIEAAKRQHNPNKPEGKVK